MRKLASLFIALSLGTATAQEGRLKIATVDMQQLFKEYRRTNEAQKEINVERARIQKDNNDRLAQIRELDTVLQEMRKQLEDPSCSESKKQSIFNEWNLKQQEGIALDRERREFLQRRNQSLNEKMVQRMKVILEEIRKLVEAGLEEARVVLTEKRADLEVLARGLLEFETLTGDEIKDLINGIRPNREVVIEPVTPRSSAVPPAGKQRKSPDSPTGDIAPAPQA